MKKRTGAIMVSGAAVAGLNLFSHWQAWRARRLVPLDGIGLPIDGGIAHILDRGHGPPIVMVHGLGGQMRNFSYALTAKLDTRFRVILVDRPGSGWSPRTSSAGASLAEQANFVARIITELRLEKPLLVGHSLGGAVSLALALDHPGLVGGLALIAPLTRPVPVIPLLRSPILRNPWLQRAVAQTIAVPALALLTDRRHNRVFYPETMPGDFETKGGGLVMRQPKLIAAGFADMAGLLDELPAMVSRYGELRLPVDILYGKDDQILDPIEQGERTSADIQGARFSVSDGGHMLPVTRPDAVADWIEEAQSRIV